MSTLQSLQKEIDHIKSKNRFLEKRLFNLEKNLNIPSKDDGPEEEKPVKKQATNFEADVGLKWFGRIGILALVIGVGYFIKLALDNGWINHLTQIVLGVIIGLALVISGELFSKNQKYIAWAQTLIGGGFAIIYFAIYAAYHFESYRLEIGISQTFDIFLLSFVVLIAVLVSVLKDSKIIATEAFLLGFVTSLLSQNFEILTLLYCLILTIGLIAVVVYKKWFVLGIGGVIATYFTYIIWYGNNTLFNETQKPFSLSSTFLITYFLSYTIQSTLIKSKEDNEIPNVVVTLINSFFFFIMQTEAILRKYDGKVWVLTLLLAVIYFVLYFITEYRGQKKLSLTYLFLSIAFLSTTIPIYFEQEWITVLWVIETFVLTVLAFELDKKSLKIASYILAGLTTLKILFIDSWNLNEFNINSLITSTRFFAFLITILAFYILVIYLERKKLKNEDIIPKVYTWLALLLTTILIILESKRFWITLWWAIVASIILITGFGFKKQYLRLQGIALFGLVILKVFLYDTSELETIYRTISFILLGVLLLSASFIYTKYKDRLKDVF